MKSNKKITMMGALVCGMLLAGCGGTGGGDTPTSSKTGGDTPTSSKAPTSQAEVKKFDVTINGEKKTVDMGTALEKPADPTAPEGMAFYGWKNTLNGGQIWDFENETLNYVLGDVNLEPCFVQAGLEAQILEAELCPNINAIYGGEKGMSGMTYSGGQQGKGLIGRDWDGSLGCTGIPYEENGEPVEYAGAYVHFNYKKGNKLTWEIESDSDAENVTILGRYSAEYGVEDIETGFRGYGFNHDSYKVTVNGAKQEYGNIKLWLPAGADTNGGSFTPFQDYLITSTVSLKAGANIIEMEVDNLDTVNGTIASSAPVIDSIKVFSTSKLTWDKAVPDNMVRE